MFESSLIYIFSSRVLTIVLVSSVKAYGGVVRGAEEEGEYSGWR